MTRRAEAILIAGANGAGKTTFARQFLRVLFPSAVFLNSDEIQREAAHFAHSVSAGKELLARLGRLEAGRASFAIETTLASTGYRTRIRNWRALGFKTTLHFIEVPSAEFALDRVALRVAVGGHAVPDKDVVRRYHRGLRLFRESYKTEFDQWYHWASDEGGLRLVDESR